MINLGSDSLGNKLKSILFGFVKPAESENSSKAEAEAGVSEFSPLLMQMLTKNQLNSINPKHKQSPVPPDVNPGEEEAAAEPEHLTAKDEKNIFRMLFGRAEPAAQNQNSSQTEFGFLKPPVITETPVVLAPKIKSVKSANSSETPSAQTVETKNGEIKNSSETTTALLQIQLDFSEGVIASAGTAINNSHNIENVAAAKSSVEKNEQTVAAVISETVLKTEVKKSESPNLSLAFNEKNNSEQKIKTPELEKLNRAATKEKEEKVSVELVQSSRQHSELNSTEKIVKNSKIELSLASEPIKEIAQEIRKNEKTNETPELKLEGIEVKKVQVSSSSESATKNNEFIKEGEPFVSRPAEVKNSTEKTAGEQIPFNIQTEKHASPEIQQTKLHDVQTLLQKSETASSIMKQTANQIALSVDEGKSQIKIILKPELLGEVHVKVTMEEGKISTQLDVQQPQVKSLIEANIPMLRSALTEKGLTLDKIDIYTTLNSSAEHSQGNRQQKHSSSRTFFEEQEKFEADESKLYGYNTVEYLM